MGGVGTELVVLFRRIGISTCSGCTRYSRELDHNGIPWCEEHQKEIVSWLHDQAKSSKVNVAIAGARLAKAETKLASLIAGMKIVHPFTDVAELAARAIVHFAIEQAYESRPTKDNPYRIVLNSQKHGFGDACVMAWWSEGSKDAAIKLFHYATGPKKVFLEMLDQPVLDRQPRMVDTFRAYSQELRQRGDPPRIEQRGRYLGLQCKPKRPSHNLTSDELAVGRREHGGEVLLWPNTDYGSREWPSFYWIELAERLTDSGMRVRVCGGSPDNRYSQFPGMWKRGWRYNAAAMLAARAVVGNDSGPAHLSGTLDVPTVVLLGPTTSSVFIQYPSVKCLSTDPAVLSCSGCYFHAPFAKSCEIGCAALAHLKPEDVFSEIAKLVR